MKKSHLITGSLLVLVVGAAFMWLNHDHGVRRPNSPVDRDREVLDRLAAAGSRLDQAHALEFFLYFPTQAAAEEAGRRLTTEGFQVRVELASTKDSWLCEAHKSMVPDLDAIVAVTARLEALATSLAGEYDGWGTAVVK